MWPLRKIYGDSFEASPYLFMKGGLSVIVISKEEAEMIREKCPEVHIRRTSQQKSKRHRYYMSEEPKGIALIAKLRNVSEKSLIRY